MRNFLRWMLGAASSESVSLADIHTNDRLNIIENIDGVQKTGILGEIASPLENCVIKLTGESAGHTSADNAILKRLLAVKEEMDWVKTILPGDLNVQLRAMQGDHREIKQLYKLTKDTVEEYRIEVRKVKLWQDNHVGFDPKSFVDVTPYHGVPTLNGLTETAVKAIAAKKPPKKSPAKTKKAK